MKKCICWCLSIIELKNAPWNIETRKTKYITEISFTSVFSVSSLTHFNGMRLDAVIWRSRKTDVNETQQTNRSERASGHARTLPRSSRADHSNGHGKTYWTSAYCIANHRWVDSPVAALPTSSYLGPYKDVASNEDDTSSYMGWPNMFFFPSQQGTENV